MASLKLLCFATWCLFRILCMVFFPYWYNFNFQTLKFMKSIINRSHQTNTWSIWKKYLLLVVVVKLRQFRWFFFFLLNMLLHDMQCQQYKLNNLWKSMYQCPIPQTRMSWEHCISVPYHKLGRAENTEWYWTRGTAPTSILSVFSATLYHSCLKVHGGVLIELCIFWDPLVLRINCLVIIAWLIALLLNPE